MSNIQQYGTHCILCGRWMKLLPLMGRLLCHDPCSRRGERSVLGRANWHKWPKKEEDEGG